MTTPPPPPYDDNNAGQPEWAKLADDVPDIAPTTPPNKLLIFGSIAAIVAIAIIAAVAGGGPKEHPSKSAAATSVKTVTAAPSTVTVQRTATTAQASVPVAAPAAPGAPISPLPGGTMPTVVCMNLQDAQDLIQEKGVFLSLSMDASGEGRRQVLDRNWVVVDQTPAPGAPITEGEAVLSVVKIGESSGC